MGLSWTPRYLGLTYCSPACGYGCTTEAHGQAKQDGRALVLRLGTGWTYRVWENMGWHCMAVSPCGRLKVHPPGTSKKFLAFLGERNTSGGRWSMHGATPKGAVQAVIAKARKELQEISDMLDGLDDPQPPGPHCIGGTDGRSYVLSDLIEWEKRQS